MNHSPTLSRINWPKLLTLGARASIAASVLFCGFQLHAYWQAFGVAALQSLGQFSILLFFLLVAWVAEGGWLLLLASLSFLTLLSF